MAARINRLTARSVQTIDKPGRHADGGNLYLNVSRAGARSWVFLYRFGGKQREMGLGNARDVSLARARELAGNHRQALLAGTDPLSIPEPVEIPTFGEAADKLIESMESSWRNPKHRAQWRMTLTKYAAAIRDLPVDQVGTPEVLSILKPLWTTKPETANRLRGRIEAVLNWAKAQSMRPGENPATWRGHLDHLLPKRQALTRGHHAAMPIDDLPAFMVRLEGVEGVSALALRFVILTAARSGEVIGATWSEIDLPKKLWIVPASRMKAGREHRVPLSQAACEILEKMEKVRTSEHVFPGAKPKKPLSVMAFEMVLRRMEVDFTTHGFRSCFRDWAAERTSFPSEVCEMALAHVVSSKVEAAYRRGDLLAKRYELMNAWDRFCNSKISKTNVDPLTTASKSG